MILAGILIGIASGMFGIGGSLIGTPILKIFFSLPDLIALATPLPTVIPTAISGAVGYAKKDLINTTIAKGVVLGGLPFTVVGALLTTVISGRWLMILTGLFIIFIWLRLIKNNKNTPPAFVKKIPTFVLAVLIGSISGFLSGLLAVGGGIVIMPAFLLFFGLSMQEAAATSLFCIAFLAIPGTIVHWLLGNIDWHLVINLCAGMIPASFVGAKIAISLKSRQLELLFSVFMLIFGLYFIFKQF